VTETTCWEILYRENSQIFNDDFYLPLYLPVWNYPTWHPDWCRREVYRARTPPSAPPQRVSGPTQRTQPALYTEPEFLNFQAIQESIPRNQLRQPYVALRAGTATLFLLGSYSLHRLFQNSSTGHTSTGRVTTTEYTQSGDCRFRAYISSLWKNQPWLVRVRGARPPLLSLLPSRTKLQCYALLRGQIRSLYFISTLHVLCGDNMGTTPTRESSLGALRPSASLSLGAIDLEHCPWSASCPEDRITVLLELLCNFSK
jgi:hypothetical protein